MKHLHITPVALLLATLAPGCSRAQHTNVLLITLDTTRADHLGCYGYPRIRTPVLDQLARDGTLFEDARSCVPITLPSHVSIFTGTYPFFHGIRDNAAARLSDEAITLTERFRANGYRTGAFVGSYVLDRQFGLDQGFETYDQVPTRRLVADGSLEERKGEEVADAALAWLRETASPFFCWIHLFDPHAPYEAPPPFGVDYGAAPYDGEIAYADHQIGRILAALRERGVLSRTIIAVTADHGESLGEHGERTHTIFVYDATLAVPFILSGPGIPRGQRLATPVSTVDVAPTLLELAALETLPAAQGRSLVGLLDGARVGGSAPEARLLYFESCAGWLNYGWSPLAGLTDGRIKLIEAPRPELYDLAMDSGEKSNAMTFSSADVEAWRKKLRDLWGRAKGGQGSDGGVVEPGWAIAHQPPPGEAETLERLGYPSGGPNKATIPFPGAPLPDPKDRIGLQAVRERALSLIREGRENPASLVDATSLLREALESDPNNAVLADYLGTTLGMQGRWDEAAETLRRSLGRRPERVEARFNLAYCLAHVGRREEAIEEAKACLEQRPNFAKAAEWIARWAEAEGSTSTAIEYWTLFIERWQGDSRLAEAAHREIDRLRAGH